MKAKALKDMQVVSMEGGAVVGTVEQVLFDTENLRVAALMIVATDGQSLLPFASVRSIGADAVTVENATASAAALPNDASGLLELNDFVGLPVLTGEGTEVGQVADITIDPTDGQITELAVHHGGRFGIGGTGMSVAGSAIRGIGPTVVTVEASAARDTPPAP